MLAHYAPWCAVCASLWPVLHAVAFKYRHDHSIMFGKYVEVCVCV